MRQSGLLAFVWMITMENLDTIGAVCSIIGLFVSFFAGIKAWSASTAASAARDAVLIRSLSDELLLACDRGKQLVDFLEHSRYSEASLRVHELTWNLSELPNRRSRHLSNDHRNILFTSREQLKTINEAIDRHLKQRKSIDKPQILKVARRVTMRLHELLGEIQSNIEQGERNGRKK